MIHSLVRIEKPPVDGKWSENRIFRSDGGIFSVLDGFSGRTVRRRAFIALFAGESLSEKRAPPLGGHHPRTVHPRRIMPDVLVVPAFEFGHPLLLVVLMKTGDSLVHWE
jgi:hypothetical protein